MRNEPPTRTSSVASAEITSPGHIHSLNPSGSIHASYTTSRGAGILRRTWIRCLPSPVVSMPDLSPRGLVSSCNVRLKRVQALFPELPVIVEPLICCAQSTGLEAAMVFASSDFAPQEPGTFQNHDVLGNCIERNGKGPCNLIDRGRIAGQQPQNCAPRRIRQCRENTVQSGRARMLNHAVEY